MTVKIWHLALLAGVIYVAWWAYKRFSGGG